MSSRGNAPVFSIHEFSELVSAALAGSTDRFDPEQTHSFKLARTTPDRDAQNGIWRTSRSCVANHPGTPTFVSPSSLSSSNNSDSPPTPPPKPLGYSRFSVILRPQSTDQGTNNRRKPKATGRPPISTIAMPAPSIISTLDTPRCVGLAMTAGPSNGGARKPFALLEKIRRQASALVKSSSSTSNSATIRNQHTLLDQGRAIPMPTVSFAPTPPHSITTFAESESFFSSSAISLDVSDPIVSRSKGRKLKHGISMDTFFRNRNAPFVYDEDDLQRHEDEEDEEDDFGSTEAATTEEGDYIPYLPLVLQHERSINNLAELRRQHQQSPPSRSSERQKTHHGKSYPPPPVIYRSTPSPTPSFSDTASTRSPITPQTPIFAHDQSSTASVSLGDDDDDEDRVNGNMSLSSFMEWEQGKTISVKEPYPLPLSTSRSRTLSASKAQTGTKTKGQSRATAVTNASDSRPFEKTLPTIPTKRSTNYLHLQHPSKPVPQCPLPSPPPSVILQNHRPTKKSRAARETQERAHPYATASPVVHADDDVDEAKVAEADTTSESCYSTESYGYDQPQQDSGSLGSGSEGGYPPQFTLLPALSNAFSQVDSPLHVADVFSMPNPDSDFFMGTALPQQRQQEKIGVGRQTVDPKAHTNGKKEKEGEWTLLLGVGEGQEEETRAGGRGGNRVRGYRRGRGKRLEDAEVADEKEKERKRVRSLPNKTASQARSKPIAEHNTKQLTITKAQTKPSKKLTLSSLSPIVSLPFAPDAQVQKPLLRLQAFFDEDSEDVDINSYENVDVLDSPTTANKKKVRSGSAHPVLSGVGDFGTDWTLSLPLPMPSLMTKSKSSASLRKKVSFSAGLRVDGATEAEIRGRSKSQFKRVVQSKPVARFEKEDEADDPETLLAAIAATRDADDKSEKELEKGKRPDREDHVRLAFEALSSASSNRTSTSSVTKAPSQGLEVPKVGVRSGNERDRSVSPSLSVMQFEQRLVSLLNGKEEVKKADAVEEKNEAEKPAILATIKGELQHREEANEGDNIGKIIEGPLPPNQYRRDSKLTIHPFPTLLSQQSSQRRPYPIGPTASSASNAPASQASPPSPFGFSKSHASSSSFSCSLSPTPSTLRQNSLSLSSRAPIGVSRDSVKEMSFSQHVHIPAKNNRSSVLGTTSASHARTPSLSMSGTLRPETPTLSSVYGRPRTPSASVLLRSTASGSETETGSLKRRSLLPPASISSSASVKDETHTPPNPIAIPQKQDEKISAIVLDRELDDTLEHLPSTSSSFSSGISRAKSVVSISSYASSSSSTATIVPPKRMSNSGDKLSNIKKSTNGQSSSRRDNGDDDLGLSLELGIEFPMPPTFRPSRPSSGSTTSANPSVSEESTTSTPSATVAPVAATANPQSQHQSLAPLVVVSTSNLNPASDQRPLAPVTPILGADEDVELPPPTPAISTPAKLFAPLRKSSRTTSPIPRCLPHPISDLDAVDTMASHWVDDEAEGEDAETEYEDAVSVISISEEDYEDAVSMLSGVFYSARSSFEN